MNQQIKQRIKQIKNGEVPYGYKKIKIGIVPNEWEENLIGDCLERVCRPIAKPTEKYWRLGLRSHAKGTFHELVESPEKVTMDELYIVRENDFLLNITFAWEHAVAVANKQDDGKLVSHRFPTYIATNKCDINYWKHYSSRRNFKLQLELISPGGAGRNRVMNQSLFLKLPAILPPLKEQQKIADILSTQDKVIELKEKLLKEKEKQKKYLMQNLLTGRKRLKGFNGEWKKVKLGEICYCLDNLRKPLNANERIKIKGNYPYYGANGVVDYISDYIFETDIILLAEDGGNFEQFETKPIAIFVDEKCWVNNHAHILKAKEEHLNLYIFYSLQHKDIRKYINGTTRTKLTKSDMEEIILEISMDIEEQKAIAEILTTADKELKLLQEELEEEKRKKKALMQLLLTGIVRIKI